MKKDNFHSNPTLRVTQIADSIFKIITIILLIFFVRQTLQYNKWFSGLEYNLKQTNEKLENQNRGLTSLLTHINGSEGNFPMPEDNNAISPTFSQLEKDSNRADIGTKPESAEILPIDSIYLQESTQVPSEKFLVRYVITLGKDTVTTLEELCYAPSEILTLKKGSPNSMQNKKFKTITLNILDKNGRLSQFPLGKETQRTISKSNTSIREWNPILCENKIDKKTISSLKKCLRLEGYDPGNNIELWDEVGKGALVEFQKAEGLPCGNLNIATLESLGFRVFYQAKSTF